MFPLTNSELADARALAAAVIAVADKQSRDFYSKELDRKNFVREFAVMCDTGFGVIATGNPTAKPLWLSIQDEFLRFNPQHLDLLKLRHRAYFDAMTKEPSNLEWNCAIALTTFVGKNPLVVQWASQSFGEANAVFFSLVAGSAHPKWSVAWPTRGPCRTSLSMTSRQTQAKHAKKDSEQTS